MRHGGAACHVSPRGRFLPRDDEHRWHRRTPWRAGTWRQVRRFCFFGVARCRAGDEAPRTRGPRSVAVAPTLSVAASSMDAVFIVKVLFDVAVSQAACGGVPRGARTAGRTLRRMLSATALSSPTASQNPGSSAAHAFGCGCISLFDFVVLVCLHI